MEIPVLFDMDAAYRVYTEYCEGCEAQGIKPLDFDSWFDLELTRPPQFT